jgi:hypothetical protein
MESVSQGTQPDALAEYITKAKEAEIQGDFTAAKRMYDAALWKAEQFSLSSGKLNDTLELVAQYYTRRFMDAQAVLFWERLLGSLRKSTTESSRMIAALQSLAVCYERINRVQDTVRCLHEIVSLEENDPSCPKERLVQRIEKLATFLEHNGQASEATVWRNQAKELKGETDTQKISGAVPKPTQQTTLTVDRKIFLGHLLTRSGIVQFDDLNKSLQVAKKLDLPIGQVLISQGLLTEEQLEIALSLQQQVKSQTLSFDHASTALHLVHTQGLTGEQALAKVSGGGSGNETDTKLGTLLVDAGLLTDAQLEEVLKRCHDSGTQLGKQLVLSRAVSAMAVATALECQESIRLNTMTVEEALAALRKHGK